MIHTQLVLLIVDAEALCDSYIWCSVIYNDGRGSVIKASHSHLADLD